MKETINTRFLRTNSMITQAFIEPSEHERINTHQRTQDVIPEGMPRGNR
jgi:hypothetical protein